MQAVLVVADEAQKAGATPHLGAHYVIFTFDDECGDLSNRPVVIWPNGHDVSEFAQSIANLPRTADEPVKLLPGTRQPSDFTDLATLADWAKKHAKIIEPNSGDGLDAGGTGVLPPEPISSDPALRGGSVGQTAGIPPLGIDDGPSPSLTDPESEEPLFDYEEITYQASKTTWSEPLDITTSIFRGRPFKRNMVPDALGDYISDESESKGTDPGISALSAIAACAGVASDLIRLQVNQHDPRWQVRPCIWTVAVGNPSTGKTPALEEPMRLVQQIDAELSRDNIRKMKDYAYAMKQYALLEAQCIKEGKPRPEEPEHPEIEQIWLDKATMEGARDVLKYSPRGVIWYRDEVSGLIAEFDRYSGKGPSGDRQRFLKLFDGGVDKQNLANHRQEIVPNWSAVLCGGIQPDAVIKYLGSLQNDGLLQRTLLCMAAPKKPGKDSRPDYSASTQFKKILMTLREHHGDLVIRMSPEASEIRTAFVRQMATRIRYEENISLASHMGKWEGYCSRLMLLYHLIDRAANGQQPNEHDRISAATAQSVVSFFLDWQLSHIQEFWNELMGDKRERSFAQTIARYILANLGMTEISTRTIYKAHWKQWDNLKPWERKEAMGLLVNAGWLTPKGVARSNDGLHRDWLINPQIKTIFAAQAAEELEARALRKQDMDAMRAFYRSKREE